MKYKWFARFLAVMFTASVLLQPGNVVYAAQVQDVAAAETESEETESAEEAEGMEMPAEENVEAPEESIGEISAVENDGLPVVNGQNEGNNGGDSREVGTETEEFRLEEEQRADGTEEDNSEGNVLSGEQGVPFGEVTESTEILPEGEADGNTDAGFPIAYAEDDIANGSYGNVEWVIDVNGKLTVSGTGDYAESSYLIERSPWYTYREQITSVEINVAGMTDAKMMFYNCINLSTVNFHRFDTSSITSMSGMFAGCSNLASINMTGFDTRNVTDMSYMFAGCSNLASLDLSFFNANQVADFTYMFDGCSQLQTIYTPSYVRQPVALPQVDSTFWGQGWEVVTELPQNQDGHTVLTRYNLNETTYVSTINEINQVLRSSRMIILRDETLPSSTNIILADGIYELAENAGSLELSNLNNVTIQAENLGKAELLAHNGYIEVIWLNNCHNVEISGIIMGHDVIKTDGCAMDGHVIVMSDSTDIKIANCDLYGCGVNGIVARNCQNINVENSIIRDCMESISKLGSDSGYFTFTNCIMSGNGRSYGGASEAFYTDYGNNSILETCILDRCTFLNNRNQAFTKTGSALPAMNGCFFHGNAWDNQEPEQSGICLNGLTWQIDGDLLKLGFPLRLDDGTVRESVQAEPLSYSASALPWKNCNYQRTVKAWEVEKPGDAAITLDPAVKFVPYDTKITGTENINYIIGSGTLPSGLLLTADGRISGVPTESGSFSFTVLAIGTDASREAAYELSVNENTDANLSTYADPGYELIELVPNLYFESIPDDGSQLMVSVGPFEEFTALYLDGEKLTEYIDYTVEPGSTRITILNQTLKRKGTGSHTLAMEFRKKDTGALKWAAQNYVIVEGTDLVEGGDGDNSDNGGKTDNNPGNDNATENNSGNNRNENQSSITTAVVENTSLTIAYTVQFGDNLSKIAQRFYGSSRSWRRIYTDNAATIRNPNRIYPGQTIIITVNQASNATPEAGTSSENASDTSENGSYIVVSGDNLYKIAQKVYGQGGRWNEIYHANRNIIANPGRIYAGQVLIIP